MILLSFWEAKTVLYLKLSYQADSTVQKQYKLYNLKLSLNDQFDQNELKMMSDDEAKKLGQLVNKVDKHVAGCLTVGYAIMIFAQLIKGDFTILI